MDLVISERWRDSQMNRLPAFGLFAGSGDKDAMWLETVEGLDNARNRMERLAAQVPGKYFVFSVPNRAVVAKTDTTKNFITMETRIQTQESAA